MKKQRKYNKQTGCYKIDIFVNGEYWASTDQHKTCRSAKEKTCKLYPKLEPNTVKAFFYYQ